MIVECRLNSGEVGVVRMQLPSDLALAAHALPMLPWKCPIHPLLAAMEVSKGS